MLTLFTSLLKKYAENENYNMSVKYVWENVNSKKATCLIMFERERKFKAKPVSPTAAQAEPPPSRYLNMTISFLLWQFGQQCQTLTWMLGAVVSLCLALCWRCDLQDEPDTQYRPLLYTNMDDKWKPETFHWMGSYDWKVVCISFAVWGEVL